jgi:hypothetical protein
VADSLRRYSQEFILWTVQFYFSNPKIQFFAKFSFIKAIKSSSANDDSL